MIKLAIQKAIEGGYKNTSYHPDFENRLEKLYFLDPLFWQSLGKSLGWGEIIHCDGYDKTYADCTKCNWHRFIDHLAENKDPESFFKDLLQDN